MSFRISPRRNATKEREKERKNERRNVMFLSYHDSHCASDADQLRCSLRSDGDGDVVVVVVVSSPTPAAAAGGAFFAATN